MIDTTYSVVALVLPALCLQWYNGLISPQTTGALKRDQTTDSAGID